jgi:hypothetical protein
MKTMCVCAGRCRGPYAPVYPPIYRTSNHSRFCNPLLHILRVVHSIHLPTHQTVINRAGAETSVGLRLIGAVGAFSSRSSIIMAAPAAISNVSVPAPAAGKQQPAAPGAPAGAHHQRPPLWPMQSLCWPFMMPWGMPMFGRCR